MEVERVAVRGPAGVVGDAARVVERAPDAVVAVGDAALRGLAADPPDVPVLPVRDDGGPLAVAPDDAAAALAGPLARHAHPLLAVSLDGETVGRALLDAALVTAEAARISEYGVRADGRRLGAFRADGVVTATPLGSAGYARAAGGPVVAGAAGLAVVPVAEFATARGAWVADPPVVCTVERDEVPVSLVVDGEGAGAVPVGAPVRVAARDRVELLAPGAESF
jgi:NAD+ kinase